MPSLGANHLSILVANRSATIPSFVYSHLNPNSYDRQQIVSFGVRIGISAREMVRRYGDCACWGELWLSENGALTYG